MTPGDEFDMETSQSSGEPIQHDGFPDPPEVVSLADARGSRKAAIRVQLDRLEENGVETFGERTMQKLANALSTLVETMRSMEAEAEGENLFDTALALEGFEISEQDIRTRQRFFEKLKGRPTPFTELLDRLETLAQSIPSPGEPQEQAWGELAAAYKRAHSMATELANSIAAGRVRMSRATAELKPAHDRTLETLPENRGEESEAALSALRAARDSVERRVHALRGAHLRAVDILESIRKFAACHQDFQRQRINIDTRAVPKWEEAVGDLIRYSGEGEDNELEVTSLRASNMELAELYRSAADAAARLSDAHAEVRETIAESGPGNGR